MNDNLNNKNQEETPPIFDNWNSWYGFVLIYLAVIVIFFYIFTKVFE